MTDFEKAEKLREKADVTFAEAKEALDNAGGDILDAIIYLEKQGKSTSPSGGGFYSGDGSPVPKQTGVYQSENRSYTGSSGESFSDTLRRFGRFILRLIDKGMTNFLDATKGGELRFSCPVIAVVALVVFLFWITFPLFVISLFLGFRYRFRGPDLGFESVNNVMDGASYVVDDVKRSFSERSGEANNTNETEDI